MIRFRMIRGKNWKEWFREQRWNSHWCLSELTRCISSLSIAQNQAPSFVAPLFLRSTNFGAQPTSLPLPIIYRRHEINEKPTWKIIETPTNAALREINDILNRTAFPIQEPVSINHTEKQAVRMIVIRKRKMKKHKLRKLRKKMKFEWGRLRQRREMRKEKAFQATLMAQIKDAEKFSAEAYVEGKLRQATETHIPRFWKGRRLPQFIIKEKLGIK